MIDTITPETLATSRLTLRPLTHADIPDLHRLLNDVEITTHLLLVPYPYHEHHAKEWIDGIPERLAKREAVNFAITLVATQEFLGSIGVHPKANHNSGELGYWIGKPFWGKGYCTEAVRAVVEYSFGSLGLNRVQAYHFSRNPASGRVLQKAGLRYEGHSRQNLKKGDNYEDTELYAILRSDLKEITRSIDPRDPWIP